jgi:hypothetical protein
MIGLHHFLRKGNDLILSLLVEEVIPSLVLPRNFYKKMYLTSRTKPKGVILEI